MKVRVSINNMQVAIKESNRLMVTLKTEQTILMMTLDDYTLLKWCKLTVMHLQKKQWCWWYETNLVQIAWTV